MIAPLQPYALAGVLRYQGESDAAAAPNTSGSGVSNLDLAAAQKLRRKIRRQVDTRYSLLSANSSTSSRPLNLNLNALRIPQGARIVVEEVSAASHGEVHAVLDLPASGTIPLTQPAASVFLISVADAAPTYTLTLGATDDAMIKSGVNSSGNYGSRSNL